MRVHAPPRPVRVTAVLPLRRNGSVRLAGRLQWVRLTDSKPHVLTLVRPRPQHVENDVLKVGQNNVPLPTKSVRTMFTLSTKSVRTTFPCQQSQSERRSPVNSQSERRSPVNKVSQNDVLLSTKSVRTTFSCQQSQSERRPLLTKSVRTTFPCQQSQSERRSPVEKLSHDDIPLSTVRNILTKYDNYQACKHKGTVRPGGTQNTAHHFTKEYAEFAPAPW